MALPTGVLSQIALHSAAFSPSAASSFASASFGLAFAANARRGFSTASFATLQLSHGAFRPPRPRPSSFARSTPSDSSWLPARHLSCSPLSHFQQRPPSSSISPSPEPSSDKEVTRDEELRPPAIIVKASRAILPRPALAWSSMKEFFSLQKFDMSNKSQAERDQERGGSYRRLFDLMKEEKRSLLLGLLFLAIASILGNLMPYCVGQLMDYFGKAKDNPDEKTFLGVGLGATVAILSALMLTGSACALARSVLMEMSGQRIVARLRKRAYSSVLNQEIEFTDSKAGSIVSRLSTDCSILGEHLTDSLQSGSRDLFAGVIALGFMLWISPTVTAVGMVAIPSTAFLSWKYGEYKRRIGRVTQEGIGEMTKVAEEKLSFVRIIAAYNTQSLESKTFSKKVDTIFEIARREIWMEGLMTDLYQRIFANHASELSIVLVGGYMVQQGNITLGSLTALLMYSYSLQGAASGLVTFYAGLNKGLGAGTRVFELIDRQPQISPSAGGSLSSTRTGKIVLKDIAFSYPSRPNAMILRGINLEIGKGESVALCGGSGSGKSSIQNLILRYYEPNRGSIEFDGQDITELSLASWRSAIGVVSQESVVFTGTIFENIAYGKPEGEASREEVEAAAEMAGCGFIWDLERGFDTPVNKTSLSGGQKQRISIARALVRKPRILLLDEATSALDSNSEQHVNAAIAKILATKEITVIVVAHRLSSIAQCDRVVVIDRGQVVEDGLYDDLAADDESRFAKLVSAQLHADPHGHHPAATKSTQQPIEVVTSPPAA